MLYTAKCAKQPYCRWCGRVIKKHTEKIFFGGLDRPKTPEEAQSRSNLPITAIRWHKKYRPGCSGEKDALIGREAYSANTWDGETYFNDCFCNNNCASSWAVSVARQTTFATPEYRKAVEKASEE